MPDLFTLDSLHQVLLIGGDVQVLDDGVERGDDRGFDHGGLFQAAHTGLWWRTAANTGSRKSGHDMSGYVASCQKMLACQKGILNRIDLTTF